MKIGNSEYNLGGVSWCSGMYCQVRHDSCKILDVDGVIVPLERAIEMKLPIVREVGSESNMAIICNGYCMGESLKRTTIDNLDNKKFPDRQG